MSLCKNSHDVLAFHGISMYFSFFFSETYQTGIAVTLNLVFVKDKTRGTIIWHMEIDKLIDKS